MNRGIKMRITILKNNLHGVSSRLSRSLLLMLLSYTLSCQAFAAIQENSTEATLTVNYNTVGTAPLQAFMGLLDPNVLVLDGPANANYEVQLGTYQDGQLIDGKGYNHIRQDRRIKKYRGRLDLNGHKLISIQPGDLHYRDGSNIAVQALITARGRPRVSTYSAATQVAIVSTMSSPVLLRPAAGSVATVLGPVTMLTADTIAVADIIFNVTADTEMENFPDLAALAIGDWVAVEGEYNGDGNEGKNALVMVVEDPSPEARLRGRIQGLGPAGFSILDGSAYLTTATEYMDDTTGDPEAYSTLEEGMVVEIRLPANTDFPYASEVRTNVEVEFEPEPEPEPEPEDEPPPPICS